MGRIKTDKNKPYSLYIISTKNEMSFLINKLNYNENLNNNLIWLFIVLLSFALIISIYLYGDVSFNLNYYTDIYRLSDNIVKINNGN